MLPSNSTENLMSYQNSVKFLTADKKEAAVVGTFSAYKNNPLHVAPYCVIRVRAFFYLYSLLNFFHPRACICVPLLYISAIYRQR